MIFNAVLFSYIQHSDSMLYTHTYIYALKESACNAGDSGLISRSEKSPGERNDYLFQYSCLKNPMDRGTWWAIVHGLTKR